MLCGTFSNAVRGTIYKLKVNSDKKTHVKGIQAEGLKTLAGIKVIGNEIWTAQLFNIIKQQKENAVEEPTVVWEGRRVCVDILLPGNSIVSHILATGYDYNQNVWLADNLDTFGNGMLLCPVYSSVAAITVDKVLKSGCLASFGGFMSQIVTACTHGENIGKAIRDPEVDLAFSNTYVTENAQPNPIRLIFLKPGDPESTIQFEVDLVETRKQHALRSIVRAGKELGKRQYFNEQVTHAAQHLFDESCNGYIACVNFEEPRILLLRDDKFKEAMSKLR